MSNSNNSTKNGMSYVELNEFDFVRLLQRKFALFSFYFTVTENHLVESIKTFRFNSKDKKEQIDIAIPEVKYVSFVIFGVLLR